MLTVFTVLTFLCVSCPAVYAMLPRKSLSQASLISNHICMPAFNCREQVPVALKPSCANLSHRWTMPPITRSSLINPYAETLNTPTIRTSTSSFQVPGSQFGKEASACTNTVFPRRSISDPVGGYHTYTHTQAHVFSTPFETAECHSQRSVNTRHSVVTNGCYKGAAIPLVQRSVTAGSTAATNSHWLPLCASSVSSRSVNPAPTCRDINRPPSRFVLKSTLDNHRLQEQSTRGPEASFLPVKMSSGSANPMSVQVPWIPCSPGVAAVRSTPLCPSGQSRVSVSHLPSPATDRSPRPAIRRSGSALSGAMFHPCSKASSLLVRDLQTCRAHAFAKEVLPTVPAVAQNIALENFCRGAGWVRRNPASDNTGRVSVPTLTDLGFVAASRGSQRKPSLQTPSSSIRVWRFQNSPICIC